MRTFQIGQRMSWETVRERVKDKRKKLGLSLREVAAGLDVSWSSVSHFETGRNNIPFDTLERLAGILGMQMVLDLATPEEARAHRFVQLVSGMTPEDVERMERVAKVLSAVRSDTLKDALTITLESAAGIRPPSKNPFAA